MEFGSNSPCDTPKGEFYTIAAFKVRSYNKSNIQAIFIVSETQKDIQQASFSQT
jgi:hypothetical protein